MDSLSLSSQNLTAGCDNPDVVSGNGGRTPPKSSGDRNQSLNAAGSSFGGQRGTSSFPPTFSGDEPRPLQTDFFRHVSLFYAHLGPEEESEQWASFLPENLRPGNIEEYLEKTDKPQLYGNNYWWLSQENSAQVQPSFNHSRVPIRYSRVQLLELKEVMAIPENILKIKQEIEAECLALNQITECGGTRVDMSGARRERRSASKKKKEDKKVANISLNLMKVSLEIGEKEEHEAANIYVNSMKEAPQTEEKEKYEVGLQKVGILQGLSSSSLEPRVSSATTSLSIRIGVENISTNSMIEPPQTGEKENHELANISVNSMQGEPQIGEKEKQEGFVSKSKKEKKKCRVLSKERKEKRRIAKKKKRAEKNRKIGVKRLKIQPLLKPKTVSHCRHYLKGRCHEGEKCKFSHDVQPLTKSLPCCHFARQSCMKGDDCPYDHDLSKYPCNKYVSTGFCPKQGNCLFSHKVMPNQDPAPTTETKASNPPPVSDSIQRHSQKPHFVFGAENSRGNVSASKADQLVKAPQGLSFLNKIVFGGNSQKGKQPVPSSTSADVIVSGKNSNKTAFGGDKKGVALPSNPPTFPNPSGVFVFGKNPQHDHNLPASPNSAGVFVFGKNPPHDHNPPTLPNSAGVSVFGKNPPPDHNPPALPNPAGVFVFGKNPPQDHNLPNPPPDLNKRNQPSLLPFGNNKTRLGGGKKDPAAPSSSPTSAFSARLSGVMKNTSSSSGPLSTRASGSSPVNSWTQGTGPACGSEPVESRVNVHAFTGTNPTSADTSKNGGASLKKPFSAVEMWEILYGKGSTN